jgi:hypothetical protein
MRHLWRSALMNLLGGGDQALRAVGHDEPQTRQSPLHQVVQEIGARIGRLARARVRPTKTGLPSVVMPQAARIGRRA